MAITLTRPNHRCVPRQSNDYHISRQSYDELNIQNSSATTPVGLYLAPPAQESSLMASTARTSPSDLVGSSLLVAIQADAVHGQATGNSP